MGETKGRMCREVVTGTVSGRGCRAGEGEKRRGQVWHAVSADETLCCVRHLLCGTVADASSAYMGAIWLLLQQRMQHSLEHPQKHTHTHTHARTHARAHTHAQMGALAAPSACHVVTPLHTCSVVLCTDDEDGPAIHVCCIMHNRLARLSLGAHVVICDV